MKGIFQSVLGERQYDKDTLETRMDEVFDFKRKFEKVYLKSTNFD